MKEQNAALLIFTRNPELGKGKRRLAATIGDQATLEIYKFLLNHTKTITEPLQVVKQVWYSEKIHQNDIWPDDVFKKHVQVKGDLGIKMSAAFEKALKEYDRVVIIGSDLYDLSSQDLNLAFETLNTHDAVIGPATDGGYYLLGFNKNIPKGIFEDKQWGTGTVYEDTIRDLKKLNYATLEPRNDVDYYEDIKDVQAFQPFLKNIDVK